MKSSGSRFKIKDGNGEAKGRLRIRSDSSFRKHLTNEWSAEASGIDDRSILIHFFDSQRRRIAARPRAIKIADDFSCPSIQLESWESLQAKVLKGDDLVPHLSTGHTSLFNTDGLLNEWGVHHFHLGMHAHPHKPNYVERSGPVVFAMVDESTFYAINVYTHGAWEEMSVVESIHRNWPEAIRQYRLRGIQGESLRPDQRRALRRKHCNAAITVQDGTTYGPIGGAISVAGTSMTSALHADRWISEIRRLQSDFEANLGQVMGTLEQAGYAGEPDIEAELRISDAGDYQVFFPRYGVLANLALTEMSYSFKTLV